MSPSVLVGWRWAEGSTDVTELPFHETWGVPTLSDVSTDGNVVVGSVYVDGTFHAVRWLFPGGTAEVLGPGVLHGTNADGHIAVGALNGEAAIWVGDEPPQVIAELLAATANLENWSLGAALAVSDDGKTIVGEGLHGSTTEGWVARLP